MRSVMGTSVGRKGRNPDAKLVGDLFGLQVVDRESVFA
jgi:hypothetical protein